MELHRQLRLAAGLVSEHYPKVSSLVINMTYYRKGENPVVMVRTVNYSPGGSAYFKMECATKDCVGGGFDLTPVIAEMVEGRRGSKKGRLLCVGSLSPGHAEIAYEITILYKK